MKYSTALRATVFSAVVTLLIASSAGAQRPASATGASSFSGSCQLSGWVIFTPPMTNTAHAFTQHAHATGTCSGSFTDARGRTHQLNNAPVRYRAIEHAPDATCDEGTDAGRGTISFPYGAIGFTISETRIGPAALVTLQGARGGSAAGQANVSPSANPQTVLAACAGKGLRRAPIQAQAATTPSISG